jgi:hypothetical protein
MTSLSVLDAPETPVPTMLILRIIFWLLRLAAVALIIGGMMVGLFPYFRVHLFATDAGSYTVGFAAAICGAALALLLLLKDLSTARRDP